MEVEREFGQQTQPRTSGKTARVESSVAENSSAASLPSSIVDSPSTGDTVPLSAPSDNILTVVGVLPDQLHLLKSYFRPFRLAFELEPPREDGLQGAWGNWASLNFAEPIEVLQRQRPDCCFGPTIQLSEHIMAACFIGRFDDEQCRPVPEIARAAEGPLKKLFKIPDMDEDMRELPMEEKLWGIGVREFALGEGEIPRKRASWVAALKSCFIPYS
jgi:hypothetical protein